MSVRARLERLERKAAELERAAGARDFVLLEAYDRPGWFWFGEGSKRRLVTRDQFEREVGLTDQDTVLEIVYVKDWRGASEGGDK